MHMDIILVPYSVYAHTVGPWIVYIVFFFAPAKMDKYVWFGPYLLQNSNDLIY